MSTPSLVTPEEQLTVRKYRKNWKNRSTYGLVLKTKLEYLMTLFEREANKKEGFDINTIINLSRSIDFNISVQLSNIRSIEEFETLEKLETWKNELINKIGSKGIQETVHSAWQY